MNSGRPSLSFWEDAYREHGPDVLSFLRRRARATADAEDLLQETFVRAIRSETGLRNLGKVRSYLFTTAQNLLINHLQRDRRVLSEIEIEAIRSEMQPEPQPAPDASVREQEMDARLVAAMKSMPEAEENAFRSAILERQSYEEVGRRHGWSRDQVKVYVYRARKRMLTELGEFVDEPGQGQKK